LQATGATRDLISVDRAFDLDQPRHDACQDGMARRVDRCRAEHVQHGLHVKRTHGTAGFAIQPFGQFRAFNVGFPKQDVDRSVIQRALLLNPRTHTRFRIKRWGFASDKFFREIDHS
jgi:hypothetical protein